MTTLNMTAAVPADLAKLAFRISGRLSKSEGIGLVAAMYDLDDDEAETLIARGKHLAAIEMRKGAVS